MNLPRAPLVAVIGAGPAGLASAEALCGHGIDVHVFDAMPSAGRKFLLAGKGGLNLTHGEPIEPFLSRFGLRRTELEPAIRRFPPDALRAWAHGLGINTFVGTSGRVFPEGMKAAPLLRAWLHRLRSAGTRFHMRHRLADWNREGNAFRLTLDTPAGRQTVTADALVLALGGGSWARLGSDGAWVSMLANHAIDVAPLRPANCGFDVKSPSGIGWSQYFRDRFAGHAVKTVTARAGSAGPHSQPRQGEFVITQTGIEGSLVYAFSSVLRDDIARAGHATLWLDLAPNWQAPELAAEIARPRGSRSLSSHLQSRTGIRGVKMALLREIASEDDFGSPGRLAARMKSLPVALAAPRPIDEAISSAGGVKFESLDRGFMSRDNPGLFFAGEMLDWEAPTGGYLLSACLASGRAAGEGALSWLNPCDGPDGSCTQPEERPCR